MKTSISFYVLLFLFTSSSIAQSTPDSLDNRLEKYLTNQIEDQEMLVRVKNLYAKEKLTFEEFIKAMFTHELEFDTTPDNSLALSKLGSYLERERPKISKDLVKELEKFLEQKDNHTMMRSMIILTIKGLSNSIKE
ncbi:MAG: hypothetical protein ROO71_02935 [Balneola sp.]